MYISQSFKFIAFLNTKLKEFQSLKIDVCHVTVTSQLNQMCSKCEIHCFSHELRKIPELWDFSENF